MALDIPEIARTDFRPTADADRRNSVMQKNLGLATRYAPARLAIALSLGLPVDAEALDRLVDAEMGKTIKGETLFGTGKDLSIWIALIVQSACDNPPVSRDQLRRLVMYHWTRGIEILENYFTESNYDFDLFVEKLAETVPRDERGAEVVGQAEIEEVHAAAVNLRIGTPGTDLATGEEVLWGINSRGGSPHVGVVGSLGTGKTLLAKDLVRQIRDTSPETAVLVFDMGKGDLAADKTFVSGIGAEVIESPRRAVPLNVFAVEKPVSDQDIVDCSRRFRDSVVKASSNKLGMPQQMVLLEGVQAALKSKAPTTLRTVRDSVARAYEEKGKDGGTVNALMSELAQYELFNSEMAPNEFFRKSWIIDVHQADEVTQRLVVFLILDALDLWLTRLSDSALDSEGNRALRVICMVDEARKVLKFSHPSLINIVRTSRSKGGAMMFITQSPDDLSPEKEDFLENIGLVACFRTNASAAALKAIYATQKLDLAGLENGVCVTRTPGAGMRRVQAWQSPGKGG